MAKRKATLRRRAWNLLRMALLWARKSGALKRRLMADLRLFASHLKGLGAGHDHPYGELHHGERELSFDETPTFHFKIHRPRFPCIEPPIKFDDNDDDNRNSVLRNPKSYFFHNEMKVEDATDDDEGGGDDDDDERSKHGAVHEEGEEEEGIDSKAEEFIAKFYEQMKLQRQISLLQYNEMLNRGMS